MGDFVSKVRVGTVKGPQQKGFGLTVWKEAFASIPNPDAVDHALFLSGICFAAEFQIARELTTKHSKELQYSEPLTAFLGFATHQWAVIKEKTAQAFREHTIDNRLVSEQISEIRIPNVMGVPFDPEVAIEALVDGARYPLTFLPSHSISKPHSTQRIDSFGMMFTLGTYYHTLEQWWLECVWNDYTAIYDDIATRLVPNAQGTHKIQAISRFRQEAAVSGTHTPCDKFVDKQISRTVQALCVKAEILSNYIQAERKNSPKTASGSRQPRQSSGEFFYADNAHSRVFRATRKQSPR